MKQASPEMFASPHDAAPPAPRGSAPTLVNLSYQPRQRWVPSRYNARTVGEDGRLILWNTFTGAISIFKPRDREAVLERLSSGGMAGPLDKTGEYLRKRGFLIRSETDELHVFRYTYGRQQFRTDVLQFILLASEDCNFRCVYCYEKFARGTMQPEVREGLRNLVRARAPQLSELNIGWFGGEPLYGWEAIEELAPYFKTVAKEHGIQHGQHMTTNGYLLTEERATRLLEWDCRRFQITLDGLPEDHDCKRVGRDGSGTYQVILDNLRALKSRPDPFTVLVRVNYDRDNFPRLGPFLESLSEDFAGDARFQMRFRAVGKWGGPNDDQLSTCGVSEERGVERQLRATSAAAGLAVEGGIKGIASPGSEVCYAARPYHFIVGADGKLMKCTVALDDMPENVVGRLNRDGSLELDDEKMSQWVSPYFENDTMCRSCHVLPLCQGATCPLTRIQSNTRSCCRTKSRLKMEMRHTLDEAAPRPAARPVLAAV
jgi:uncharacterized protein